MPKLDWRVKLVADLQPGVTTETEVARLERDEEAGLAELGLRLEEAKQSALNNSVRFAGTGPDGGLGRREPG